MIDPIKRRGKGGKVEGVMIGIVTDNKDPENLARVKLKFPLRENEHETDWVRIATLMAGKDRGSLFIPEVGDEVLVAFHMGDMKKPYVIGALWSKTQPAIKGNAKNDIRKFTSRAGHEIIFDDNDSDGKVTIKTKKGHTIEIADKTDTLKVEDKGANNSVTIKGGASGEITIKSSTSKITMNAKGDIEISSTKEIKIKSTQVNIEASASMAIKAGAMLDLKSDGIINIKGSMVKIN